MALDHKTVRAKFARVSVKTINYLKGLPKRTNRSDIHLLPHSEHIRLMRTKSTHYSSCWLMCDNSCPAPPAPIHTRIRPSLPDVASCTLSEWRNNILHELTNILREIMHVQLKLRTKISFPLNKDFFFLFFSFSHLVAHSLRYGLGRNWAQNWT